MTPCPKCHEEPFGIMLGPPEYVEGDAFAAVKCGSCGAQVGTAFISAGVQGVGSCARKAWEDAVTAQ